MASFKGVIIIEENKFYNVDCLIGMKDIKSRSVDLIFCDLPYGVTQNKKDIVIAPEALWAEYNRILKSNGVVLLFGQDKFTAKMMLSNEKMHKYNIIWDKTLASGFLNAKRMPLRSHEDIMVFYNESPTYNPQMTLGAPCHSKGQAVNKASDEATDNKNYGKYKIISTEGNLKYPKSIWEFPKPHPSTTIHPTQKSIDLCRYAIRTYSNEGDLVLDNCCGSGTIPIAAALEGRRFIGMDNGVCQKKGSLYNGLPWAEVASIRLESTLKEVA